MESGMKLYHKTLAIVLSTFLVLIIVFNLLFQSTAVQGLYDSENRTILKDLDRAFAFISDEEATMVSKTKDNAHWDVTYSYVQDPEGQFVGYYFPKETFHYMNLNFVLLYNLSGSQVDGGAYDFSENKLVPIPNELSSFITANPNLREFSALNGSHEAFVQIPQGSLMLTSAPVLTTNESGPIMGTLMMGRYIDSIEVEKIASTAHIDLDIRELNSPSLPKDYRDVLNGTELFVNGNTTRILGPDLISSYGVLDGINGNPLLIVRVSSDRAAFNQEMSGLSYFNILLLVAMAVDCLALLLLLRSYILHPLSRLSDDISRIGREKDLNAKVGVSASKDEISSLGVAFNDMLSELHQKTATLMESERSYRELIETTPDWIWQVDDQWLFVFNNRSVKDALGYTPEELKGRKFFELLDPADGTTTQINLEEMAQAREPFSSSVMRLKGKDGGSRFLEINASPMIGPEGGFLGYRGIGRDITERKRAERALENANKQLNLLSTITRHDILNQTTILRGFLELMSESTSDPKMQSYIAKQKMAVETIDRQIRFTSIYTGLGTNQPIWQDVGARIKAASKQLDFGQIRFANEVEGVEVLADPILEKVFFNLLDNAIRHSGGTEVIVRKERRLEGLVLLFQDNGKGVPEGMKEQIFMRGYGQNTGLGLFLVREILAITGMSISETGQSGKGARFEIMVPNGVWRQAPPDKSAGQGDKALSTTPGPQA